MENVNDLQWDEHGLLPAIAQAWPCGEVLMLAWMNKQALEYTISEGRAVYWSRSRQKLWRKGERSGFIQHVREIRVDCDLDTILLKVEQVGDISCHTGRAHCFFWQHSKNQWRKTMPVLKPSAEIYGEPDE